MLHRWSENAFLRHFNKQVSHQKGVTQIDSVKAGNCPGQQNVDQKVNTTQVQIDQFGGGEGDVSLHQFDTLVIGQLSENYYTG